MPRRGWLLFVLAMALLSFGNVTVMNASAATGATLQNDIF